MAMTDSERALLLRIAHAYRMYIVAGVGPATAIPGGVPRDEVAQVDRLVAAINREAELRSEEDSQ